jgi:hypothetical protein
VDAKKSLLAIAGDVEAYAPYCDTLTFMVLDDEPRFDLEAGKSVVVEFATEFVTTVRSLDLRQRILALQARSRSCASEIKARIMTEISVMTTAAAPTAEVIATTSPTRGLAISLWTAQILLAVVFGLTGSMKVFTPIEMLSRNIHWAGDAHVLTRFIGIAELAGMLGLLLPSLTGIKPKLTGLAAAGIFLVMLLATGFHVSRSEVAAVPVTLGLGSLAGFVAWGRFRKAPIPSCATGR